MERLDPEYAKWVGLVPCGLCKGTGLPFSIGTTRCSLCLGVGYFRMSEEYMELLTDPMADATL